MLVSSIDGAIYIILNVDQFLHESNNISFIFYYRSTESTNIIKRAQHRRFLWYSLYGWGMPTVLTSITASLSKSDVLPENIRPMFGHGRCWFTCRFTYLPFIKSFFYFEGSHIFLLIKYNFFRTYFKFQMIQLDMQV